MFKSIVIVGLAIWQAVHQTSLHKGPFKEFFESIKGTVKGLKGYAILENIENDKETIVLTFWHNREDMEKYYSTDNNILSELVEKVKPMFEQMPERIKIF